MVLYGMQFGNGRSLQFLLSIFISIAEDILVLQPLKVLLFALAFALLVQKPDEGEFESAGDFDDDEVEQVDISGSQSSIPEKKRVPSSPRSVSPKFMALTRSNYHNKEILKLYSIF